VGDDGIRCGIGCGGDHRCGDFAELSKLGFDSPVV
jgi:hypothetical protein